MKKRARQREFGFMGWGGRLRGAGRKPAGERAGVPHVKRPRKERVGKVAESSARLLARAHVAALDRLEEAWAHRSERGTAREPCVGVTVARRILLSLGSPS